MLKKRVEIYETLLDQLKGQVDSAGQLAVQKALQEVGVCFEVIVLALHIRSQHFLHRSHPKENNIDLQRRIVMGNLLLQRMLALLVLLTT